MDDISPTQLTEGAPSVRKGRALYKCKGPEVGVGRCSRDVRLLPEPPSQPLQELGACLWPSDHRSEEFQNLDGIQRQTPPRRLEAGFRFNQRKAPTRVGEALRGRGGGEALSGAVNMLPGTEAQRWEGAPQVTQ